MATLLLGSLIALNTAALPDEAQPKEYKPVEPDTTLRFELFKRTVGSRPRCAFYKDKSAKNNQIRRMIPQVLCSTDWLVAPDERIALTAAWLAENTAAASIVCGSLLTSWLEREFH